MDADDGYLNRTIRHPLPPIFEVYEGQVRELLIRMDTYCFRTSHLYIALHPLLPGRDYDELEIIH